MSPSVVEATFRISVIFVRVEATTQALGHRIFELLVALVPKANPPMIWYDCRVFLESWALDKTSPGGKFWHFSLLFNGTYF